MRIMNKPVQIKRDENIDYNIQKYIKPEYVYIPLENKNGVVYKHLVKEGDYIYKGQVVAVNEGINFPIHSSVSGYATMGNNKIIDDGKKVKCIVIKNDFKEKYQKSKLSVKEKYTKQDFIDALRENGITGLGGSDFPTFLKYNIDRPKCLIVNAVECEPFVSCDKVVIHNYSDCILEAIDMIMEIMRIPRAIIGLKENNLDSINSFKKYLGTYPKIKLGFVKDAYPNGWERNLVRELLDIEYDKYPTEQGIIVSNVSTIYAIYEMFKYNRPLTERIITITGTGIKNRRNVKVKIGATISEIIANLDGYNNLKNPIFIAGGPMMGNSLPVDDVIITKDLNAVLVIEDDFEKNLPCIKCGKCIEVCPAGIYPVFIMNNGNNIDKLKELKPGKCIECGLCSFICPSKIEVREFVRMAKVKVSDR